MNRHIINSEREVLLEPGFFRLQQQRFVVVIFSFSFIFLFLCS